MEFEHLFRRLAFWGTLIIALLFILLRASRMDYKDGLHAAIDFVVLGTYASLLWQFSFWLDKYSRKRGGKLRDVRFSLLVQAMLSILVGTLLVIAIESLVYYTLKEEQAPISYFIARGVLITTVIQVLFYSIRSVYQNRQMEVENANLRQENTQAQLDVFRQQVNPHFLFNALNSLRSLIQIKHPETGDFVVRLSEVYRYQIQGSKENKVTLEQELQMLDAYAYLLRVRFQDNFALEIQLPDSLRQTLIPTLTLQILLENSVKHNVVSSEKHLKVLLTTSIDQRYLLFSNNLQPKRTPAPSTGLGLENIDQRYRLICGEGIQIVRNGQEFIVQMPVIRPNGVSWM